GHGPRRGPSAHRPLLAQAAGWEADPRRDKAPGLRHERAGTRPGPRHGRNPAGRGDGREMAGPCNGTRDARAQVPKQARLVNSWLSLFSDWTLALLPRLFLYPGGAWALFMLLWLRFASEGRRQKAEGRKQ